MPSTKCQCFPGGMKVKVLATCCSELFELIFTKRHKSRDQWIQVEAEFYHNTTEETAAVAQITELIPELNLSELFYTAYIQCKV